jgi:LmbE family N-acetylglucosaminyl deacetylase
MADITPEKLVCVFAHPDDEAFGPGGSIAHFAKICPVYIICVTDGDGGHNERLGEIRKKELQESGKVLGVKDIFFLGFHDGDLSNNLYHTVADRIRTKLDELTPDTVMTFDVNGVSGHLDHIAVAMMTSYIFEKTDYVRTLMYFCAGGYMKDLMKDYFVYVPPGYPPEQIDCVLNVTGVFETKVRAMRKHISQKEDCDMILDKMKDHMHEEYFRIVRRQT